MLTMFRRQAIGAIGLILAIALTSVSGCHKKSAPGEKTAPTQDSGELMTCLALIRAHHKQADIYLKMGELDNAIRTVAKIPDLRCPRNEPEAVEAMLDAHGRLATLLLKKGAVNRAATVVDRALKKYDRDSFFMAHLMMVQADVLEAQAKMLVGRGKTNQAKVLRRKAIAVLSRSIEINRRLQKELLGEVEK
jgi:tetratricopeptide (TPR) repeat protein